MGFNAYDTDDEEERRKRRFAEEREEIERLKKQLERLLLKPHKVMTREEYNALSLKGWHMVCHDVDGAGGTGVRYLGN